jgi:hypothetical protein
MVNESPQSKPPAESVPSASGQTPPGDAVHIAEDLAKLDTQDRSRIFVVAGVVLAVIAVVVVLVWLFTKPKPKGSGSIVEAYAVALPDDKVLATVRVSFTNVDSKPLWIREVKARLTGADGVQHEDDAASAADFDRYFSAYPELRGHSIQPLKKETKVGPGGQVQGSVIVSFPVTLDAFNQRKGLAVIVVPYAAFVAPMGNDAIPVVITEAGR